MGAYAVGIATRNKIYQVAKGLFYEKGIKDTSYNDICSAAEVNKGLIPYYFKSKNNIAELVLNDFIKSMEEAVGEHWRDASISHAMLDTLIELMQFRLFARDERVCRFYHEIMSESFVFERATKDVQTYVMQRYMGDFGVTVPDAQLSTVVAMVQGTERELVRLVYTKTLSESIEDMVRRDMLCCLYLLGIDDAAARESIDRAFELAEGVSLVSDSMFNCHIECE